MIGVIAAVLVSWRSRPDSSSSREVAGERVTERGLGTASGRESAPTHDVPAPSRVRRLAPEERRRLGEQIAQAIQRARTASRPVGATSAAEGEDPIIPLEAVGKPLQDALTDAIPILAECYTRQGSSTPQHAAALMTMISDPELGTVIDTEELKDADGNVLDRELDTCLRDAIDSLALPPLGQPGKLQLQYTFRFDDEP